MSLDLSAKIQQLRRSLGKNQTEFGELFGVTQGSVSRWEKGSLPESIALAKMAELAGQDIISFLGSAAPGAEPTKVAPRLKVRGEVAAGVWKEAFEWPEDEWFEYTGGAHVHVDSSRRFGLRVTGDSMNMVYPHGTVLDCVSAFNAETPRTGQRVVVLRLRDTDELEATVKEFIIDADGRQWLVPRSHNPAFQRPISVDDPEPGIIETRIVALVVGSYQPESF